VAAPRSQTFGVQAAARPSADADASSEHGGHAVDVADLDQRVPVHREQIVESFAECGRLLHG